ncbi:MAG: biosynthetic-type acetolactate synthase large subunit [Epulopiscium sp.]|nr:biosynthetic-type acetolactate synthase large subunit [Candidatus Epulonipiscium sp.]
MEKNGAQIIIECLVEQGVDTVFGYPGGAVLHIYDELYKNSDRINHILTAHEQGASHAADGYARATGKVGVCIATSGPGATNLVTGIATAYMDSVPMVAITGNVGTSLLGKDSFQEVDIAGITMPITKHNYIVKDVKDLADTIREAFKIASSGRPGPVLIDIPKDITMNTCKYSPKTIKPAQTDHSNIKPEDIELLIKLIEKSKKPMIFAGGGIISSGSSQELLEFVEHTQIPVTTSLMGTGGFPSTHKLYTGMLGMHGTMAANMGVTNADLLIVLGARFSDRVTSDTKKFAPYAKVVHIDLDPAEIDKNVESYHHIVGDVKEVLNTLTCGVPKQNRDKWIKQITDWKEEFPLKYQNGSSLRPQYIIEQISEISKQEAIITTEVGQHQMWAAQFYKYKDPRTFITSGGLGTMGYGTGASIGAQVGMPDKKVVHIAGDGSFRMNCNELATISYYNIPVTIVIINNQVLGMVRQWQTLFYDNRHSQTTLDRGPDFVKLADAYDIEAYRVSTQEDFNTVFEKAYKSTSPVLIDCQVDQDEFVLPMVAPGAPINDLILD